MTNPNEPLNPADAVRAALGAIPIHPAALLNEVQVGELLNVSIRTLQAWRLRGGGPRFVRLSSKAVRYQNADIAAFIKSRTVASTSDPGTAALSPAPAEG